MQTRTILALAAGFAAAPVLAQPEAWSLIWADDFEGAMSPDWTPQLGNGCAIGLCGWGNEELQHYTGSPSNLFVEDGILHIVARDNGPGSNPRYTSARIRTAGGFAFRYGRVEARVDLPKGKGIWPALWMLPENSPYGGWPQSGEIDILESINQADRIHGTLHFGRSNPYAPDNAGVSDNRLGDYSTDFHVYAMEWEAHEVRWYIDGRLFGSVNSDRWWTGAPNASTSAPFDQAFHLLLNIAIGGRWPGNPDGSTQFPQTMRVDYVHVYEPAQTPFSGAPAPIPGVVQLEDFDYGGGGTAHLDYDHGNHGNAYRGEDVDVQSTAGGGWNIGWVEPNEWLEHTVDIRRAGAYTLTVRHAGPTAGGAFRLLVDGADVSGRITPPGTGDWQAWGTLTRTVQLPAGVHVLRTAFEPDSAPVNLDWFRFELDCPADWDASGDVSVQDLIAFLSDFGAGDADADGSGSTNVSDLIAFLTAFGEGC